MASTVRAICVRVTTHQMRRLKRPSWVDEATIHSSKGVAIRVATSALLSTAGRTSPSRISTSCTGHSAMAQDTTRRDQTEGWFSAKAAR